MKESKKFGKLVLADGGVNVLQKDIKSVELLQVTTHVDKCGEGLDPDFYSSRDIVVVEMNDGMVYEALREAVDKDGNYSTVSARKITKEVRVKD